jgi:hypothetical protein
LVAPDGHGKVMVGDAFSKTRLSFMRRAFASSSRENSDLYVRGLAHKMPFLRKQILLHNVQRLGKIFDLFASGHTPQILDIRKYIPRHVDAAEQMQFGDEGILRQSSLIAPPCEHTPNRIGILGH